SPEPGAETTTTAQTETQVAAREAEQQLGVRALEPEPEPEPVVEPAVVVAEIAPPPVARGADHTAENWVGAVAITLGIGAYGAAWGLWDNRTNFYGRRLAAAEPTDVDYLSRQSAWIDAQLPVWGIAGAGALLWTVAVPLTFGPDHEVPWWSWLLGGVGVVGSGVGIAVLATTTLCTSAVELDQPCVDAAAQQDLGFLVLAQSVPFLAFPITHLVRAASGSDVRASARITSEQAVVSVGGVW
ncbi:MAG: hypothetical protein J0L92_38980, partial [Deltaproteobacteria bacterium]|nr:hypothetical protein [Deltaproteobacteria bacterium]